MKNERLPVWLPFLSELTLKNKGTGVHFKYKGGEGTVNIKDISSILLYEDTVDLDISTLETITRKGVPIVFHRRHIANCMWIHGGFRKDCNDIDTKQILVREDERKKRHIVRKLLNAKFKESSWLQTIPNKVLKKEMSVDEMRNTESIYAKKYWHAYYEGLGFPEYHRRESNPISAVLNAVSKFCSSIILRWALYHHLSPFHGFLHKPTDYPGLVYDLYEPYRCIFDKVVFEALLENKFLVNDNIKITAIVIDSVKAKLYEKVYTDLTNQVVTYHELMHGICLSLRAYLLGHASQFLVPLPGIMTKGRPKIAGFKLYGRQGGLTDFNREASFYSVRDSVATIR